jgi:ubiquitin carboxyl-terminal hydrolase 8
MTAVSTSRPLAYRSPSSFAASGMAHSIARPPVAAQKSNPSSPYDPYQSPRPSYFGYETASSPHYSRPPQPATDYFEQQRSDAYLPKGLSSASYNAGYPRPPLQPINGPQPPPVAAQPYPSSSRPAAPPVPTPRLSAFYGYPGQQAQTANRQYLLSSASWGDGSVGKTGLKNLGNTCYMNSTLQCLSATIPLARFFNGESMSLSPWPSKGADLTTDGSYKRDLNFHNPLGTRGALAEAVAGLIKVLWSEQYNFVTPITFRVRVSLPKQRKQTHTAVD